MNLSIFLMAGSESTSIALTTLIYVLATMPEEQEKLVNEIYEHFPPSSEVLFFYLNALFCFYLFIKTSFIP